MHAHTILPEELTRVLKAAIVVTILFVAVEFAAGLYAHSLALLSDAAHNLTDIPAFVLSWFALYFERKQPTNQKTYGYHRAGVLAAFVNALILVVVAFFIFKEAIERFRTPVPVAAIVMVWVSLLGLAVNGTVAWALHRGRGDVNIRAVFIHNLGDAASNLGVIVAALLIASTGLYVIDPLISLAIGAGILWSCVGILKETTNVLLEGLPKGMKLEDVARAMLTVPQVQEIHDIHIWSLSSHLHALSAHVKITDMATSENEKIRHQIAELLAAEFGITHVTIQFEHTHLPGEFHTYLPAPAAPSERKPQ